MLDPSLKDNSTYPVIIAHYISAALFFLAVTVLLAFSSEAFIGHYFHPKVLAITHITTLGWISFIIIGSLYQLVPVLSNKKIHSPIISIIVYLFILTGTVFLAFSFWTFNTGFLLQIGASILFLGITLFLINVLLTVRGSKEKGIELDFIQASIMWFWLTAFIGTLLAFNFSYAFLPKEHLYYLKIHAHIGLIGWFLCLIIGVAAKLIPMFLLSGKLNTKYLIFSYYAVNFGLLGFIIDALFFNGLDRAIVYLVIILSGIMFFLNFIFNTFKTRARRKLDINLKHTCISFFFIAIPILLWALLKGKFFSEKNIELQVSSAIVFSVLFGFITLLILGQTYKNLSFIVWLKKYQGISGKFKTPLPKDLYSEKLASLQLYIFIIGLIIVFSGILISNSLYIKTGSIFLIGTATVYNINVFKIVLHKNNSTQID